MRKGSQRRGIECCKATQRELDLHACIAHAVARREAAIDVGRTRRQAKRLANDIRIGPEV